MGDFEVTGRIEKIGPSEFFVVASAVSLNGVEPSICMTLTAHSLPQANHEKSRLVAQVVDSARDSGHRVINSAESSQAGALETAR